MIIVADHYSSQFQKKANKQILQLYSDKIKNNLAMAHTLNAGYCFSFVLLGF